MSTSERNLRHPSDWGVVFTLWKLKLFHKRTKKLNNSLILAITEYYLCLTLTFIFKIINILCENSDCHWNKWHLVTYSSTSVFPVLDKLVQAMSNDCQLLRSVKIHFISIFLIICGQTFQHTWPNYREPHSFSNCLVLS